MSNQAVERSIWIDAPRDRVWQAVTEPEQIAQWFLPSFMGAQMRLADNGTLSISMGPMQADIARLEDMDPPRQVTSRGLPDQWLATTYSLAEDQGGTRVTVTMTGFDALPDAERHDRFQLSGTAWEKALQNLKAFIDGTPKPFDTEAGVAPLYGYWRAAKGKPTVERSIWINAPRERVWRAVTDPAQVGEWFSPGTQWRGTGLVVGGQFGVYNPETDSDMYIQIIDVVDPPHQFVTHSAPPEKPYVTAWTLTEEKGGTRLTLTYTGYELVPEAERWMNMEQNTFGFGMMLENLAAYIEGRSLPYPGGF